MDLSAGSIISAISSIVVSGQFRIGAAGECYYRGVGGNLRESEHLGQPNASKADHSIGY
jgi:hypothetical protein